MKRSVFQVTHGDEDEILESYLGLNASDILQLFPGGDGILQAG